LIGHQRSLQVHILKTLLSDYNNGNTNDISYNRNKCTTTSTTYRRNIIVTQHQQQQQLHVLTKSKTIVNPLWKNYEDGVHPSCIIQLPCELLLQSLVLFLPTTPISNGGFIVA
jgi:hypothetical protein